MAPDFLAHPTLGLARLSPVQRRALIGHTLYSDAIPARVSTALPRGIFDNHLLQRGCGTGDAISIITLPDFPAIEGYAA